MKRACLLLAGLVWLLPASDLKIGVGSTVITPFLDTRMAGYYYPRTADGVHDDLHAKALVFDDGQNQIVLVACDAVSVRRDAVEEARRRIQKKWGIPPSHVLISATHSHTGPVLTEEYGKSLSQWIADSVMTAQGRKQTATLFVATEQEASLPHYRRYFMKDGSVRTNPGFLNPDVVKPAGEIDPTVGVLYAEDALHQPVLTWVNYAMHQDTVGGTWISADYAHFLAQFLGKIKGPEMLTVFTIGTAGNINHWDVRRPGPQRGFETARRLGEVLGSAVAKAYTHLEPLSSGGIRAVSEAIDLPLAKVTPEEIEQARKILAQPPPPNVDFTIERVHASKVMRVHNRKGQPIRAEVQALAVGPVAFIGIPGELFVELGRRIRSQSPFPYTFVVELANDGIGYLPTRLAFQQGSYEPTSSPLEPGAGEKIADTAIGLLKRLAAR
jgi:hypothetical protein